LAGVQNHNYIQHHDVMQQVLIALWYKCCCYGISRNNQLQEGHVYQEYHQGIIVSNAVWLKDTRTKTMQFYVNINYTSQLYNS